jgi:leucine dehydrogenase
MLNAVTDYRMPTRGVEGLTLTDITEKASKLPDFDDHERIWLGRDEKRGLTAIVAIHNTALGPALGGTRVWPHPTFDAALTDALRLSRGMTFKSAIANMPFGGGKAVIWADSRKDKKPALLDAYADMLRMLDGEFYTGEDVGLTLADADYLRARTPNISGTTIGGSGNPSPVTARGVFLGLKAAWKHKTGSDKLAGVWVAIQGLGSVGWALAEFLNAEGAHLVVADIDPQRVVKAVQQFGAKQASTDEILFANADILAPCALGGILDEKTIPNLKVKVVAGAANNQLAHHCDARLLLKKGVIYAPDYVINAGGLINVALELIPGGYNEIAVEEKLSEIPAVVEKILARAEKEGKPTNDISLAMAKEKIEAARRANR